MRQDTQNVLFSFTGVLLALFLSTSLYQNKLAREEQNALVIEQQAQKELQKEQQRLIFLAELEKAAEVQQLQKESALQTALTAKEAQALLDQQAKDRAFQVEIAAQKEAEARAAAQAALVQKKETRRSQAS